ncbi:MAG TPA: hypothetical protein VMF06_09910 [Candidatus Limnocylindria bacterium]|nr:hypothetical protein [Candidatus Limnocylindria bacterium]
MRVALWITLIAWLSLGCHSQGGSKPQRPTKPVPMRPLDGQVGKVFRVNLRLKFVVLDYSLNQIPELGTHLFLYRQGEKVGELSLNGPVQGETCAADIVSGTPLVGDTARTE